MPLIDHQIRAAFDSGPWTARIDGETVGGDALKIGANSVDLSIGAELLKVEPTGRQFIGKIPLERRAIDLHDADSFETIPLDAHNGGYGVTLMPGELYLAASRESFETSEPLWIPQRKRVASGWDKSLFHFLETEVETYFVQGIEGRSTAARIGLSTHQNAGFGDWDFSGQWVFELQVALPTKIYAGNRLAQVFFAALTGKPETAYSGAYTQQSGPTAAKLGADRFQGHHDKN